MKLALFKTMLTYMLVPSTCTLSHCSAIIGVLTNCAVQSRFKTIIPVNALCPVKQIIPCPTKKKTFKLFLEAKDEALKSFSAEAKKLD